MKKIFSILLLTALLCITTAHSQILREDVFVTLENGQEHRLYRYLDHPTNKIAAIKKDDKYAMFNLVTNEFVTQFKYDGLHSLGENTIEYVLHKFNTWGQKSGIMNTNGDILTDTIYDNISHFFNGIARVVILNDGKFLHGSIWNPQNGKYGYINPLGNDVIKVGYSYIDIFAGYNFVRFSKGKYDCDEDNGCANPFPDGKWGIMNEKGEVVVADHTYDYIWMKPKVLENNDHLFGVQKGKNYYIIDQTGKVIFDFGRSKKARNKMLEKVYGTKKK